MTIKERILNRLAESEKVELAVGDELKVLASKTDAISKKLNQELDEAFEPIRRIEKISESIPSKINGFKDFTKSLQKMELQYSKDVQKLKSAEQDLGVKIERPKALDVAVKKLEYLQRLESDFRKEINDFIRFSKKYR